MLLVPLSSRSLVGPLPVPLMGRKVLVPPVPPLLFSLTSSAVSPLRGTILLPSLRLLCAFLPRIVPTPQ